jgi:hypothetical protein
MIVVTVIVGLFILIWFGSVLLTQALGAYVALMRARRTRNRRRARGDVPSRRERVKQYVDNPPVLNRGTDEVNEPAQPTSKRYFIVLGNLPPHEIEKAEIAAMKKQHYKVIDETGAPV